MPGKKISREKFNDAVAKLNHRDIAINWTHDDYVGVHTKYQFDCLVNGCNHKWESRWSHVVYGESGCPKCVLKLNTDNQKLTNEQFILEVAKLNERKIAVDWTYNDYKNVGTKYQFTCSVDGCNHKWKSTWYNIVRGKGCLKCSIKLRAGKLKFTEEEFNDAVLKLNERKIAIDWTYDDYVGVNTKYQFICSVDGCNHKWQSRWKYVINDGNGCPACSTTGYNPKKPGYFYILRFQSYIKYGITNVPDNRFIQHKKNNGDHKVLHIEEFVHGNVPKLIESKIKNHFGRNACVSDKDCTDGWTETIPLERKNELFELYSRLKVELNNVNNIECD